MLALAVADTSLCSRRDRLLPDQFPQYRSLPLNANLFLSCRGCPEAVNISKVTGLLDAESKPHFKYIVEGANLFFTQQARSFLDKCKVVMFKDSWANRSGVTSSSLEFLVGLSLADADPAQCMVFKEASSPPEFY